MDWVAEGTIDVLGEAVS